MTLDEIQRRVKFLPYALTVEAAPELAKAIRLVYVENVTRQETPYGDPWPPRKRGTKPVLVGAPAAITASSSGPRINITILGINARHHKGAVRGSVQRQMIPYRKDGQRGITPAVREAIVKILDRRFRETTGGGSSSASTQTHGAGAVT